VESQRAARGRDGGFE